MYTFVDTLAYLDTTGDKYYGCLCQAKVLVISLPLQVVHEWIISLYV
jgi:hypothetical protein